MSIPPVDLLPDLHADTPGLRDAARSLREKSRHAREHLNDAHSGWRGLRSAYHHNSTQERVWDGLDLLDDPVDAWVDAIGRAADEQAYLLLTYPNIFGNMNGVPMQQRAQAGALNVRGHLAIVEGLLSERDKQESWEDRIPGYGTLGKVNWGHPKAYAPTSDDEEEREEARKKWLLDGVKLKQNKEGLTAAWQQYVKIGKTSAAPSNGITPYKTVYVNPSGSGQIVTMQGEFSEKTSHINTFVPGTYTTMASAQGYNSDLQKMTGDPREDTVNFYWAGTDFPGSHDPQTGEQIPPTVLTDNMTSQWSENGAPRLAAFDQAVDLENSTATQTTIAHSAGTPLAGTAERHDNGMTTDKFLYLAPAGTGHNVGSPAATVNPDADRAVIQTREDPIWISQTFGGAFHGDNFAVGGDPSERMDAPRLESGMAANSTPENRVRVGDGPAGGHSDLWHPDTTSRDNIEAFIYEKDLIPEIPAEIHPHSSPQHPVVVDGLDANPNIATHDGFDIYKKPYDEVIN